MTKLLRTAGLLAEHTKTSAADPDFEANWLIVKDLDISSRYEQRTDREPRDMFDAAADAQHGVLSWIERYW